jgi:hypothetical protein
MANNPKPQPSIQDIFIIIGALAVICVATIAIVPRVLPMIVRPTPTAIPALTSTPSILAKQSFAETSAASTDTSNPARTSTIIPTDTPTYTGNAQSLPDLTVGGISNPICARDHLLTTPRDYVKLSVIVRNVGRVSTRSFGPFSVLVNLIFGQQRYSLDEWASSFNGVIDSSDMDISILHPTADVKLNLAIDLKGNTNFGVEVIVNSGSNPIPESDTTNNILIQDFSVICV